MNCIKSVKSISQNGCFFLGQQGKWWSKGSVRLLLIKTPTTVSRLNGYCGPGRQLARYWDPPRVLTPALPFFKWSSGSSSEVTPSLVGLHSHIWWADKSRNESRPPTHGVNPCVPLVNLTLDLTGMSGSTPWPLRSLKCSSPTTTTTWT